MSPQGTDHRELEREIERLRLRLAELEEFKAQVVAAEEELRHQKEFSDTVLNAMRDAIYVIDPKSFRIIDCNQVFLRRYGLVREKVIGETCFQVKRQRSKPCSLNGEACPSQDTTRSGLPATSEWDFSAPEGEVMHIESSALPVQDKNGRVSRVVHVDRDITRRKLEQRRRIETNKELSRSNAFLRNLIMSSVDAVIASDMTGKILIFNQAAGRITGYSEDEALGELDIRRIYPGDGAREVMRKLRSGEYGGKGKLESLKTGLLAKDGSTVPISLSAAVVYEGEREVSTVGFFYDLRDKLKMERELDKTRVQLLQAEKMASIGKLAAGVAHQLNNPLAGITLYAHILKEEYDLPADAKDDLGRILNNAERSRDTVKELLQFARQTSQEIRLSDLNEALRRTTFLLENQSLLHDIEIALGLDPKLPLVPADLQQLNHVFMNLILNAAEAMEGRGRIHINTRLSPEGDRAVVEIGDNGPGVPRDVLPHLFEPFFTTKEQGKGTGLGLSVAFGVIENHRGKISAHNLPEGGASFVIELPLPEPDEGV